MNISLPKQNLQLHKLQIECINKENDQIQPFQINLESPKNKTGHWVKKQKAKYYSFLKVFYDKFDQKPSRRECKVFKVMSQFIKTRNANQCRSHHHKMEKNHLKISQILASLQTKTPSLKVESQKYSVKLQVMKNMFFGKQNFPIKKNMKKQSSLTNKISVQQINPKFQNNCKEKTSQEKNNSILKTADTYQISISQKNDEFINIFLEPAPQYFQCTNMLSPLQLYSYPITNSILMHNFITNQIVQCQEIFTKWYNKVQSIIEVEKKEQNNIANNFY